MKICVIFNPVARGEKARRFRRQIAGLSGQCVLRATTGPGGGRPLAAEAVREGFTTVVAAGGDGTLNEVLNGIGDVPDGFGRATLGVLPLGTVNVFAKEIGIPAGVRRAWDVLQAGRTRTLDLAAADYTVGGAPVRRHFVQMAGAGLDARAIDLVDWEYKKRLGKLAYILAALQAMRHRLPPVAVTVGQETCQGELVLVGNGRFYGGRFVLFPGADPADGMLEVTIFPKVNWRAVACCGWNVLTGRSPAAGQALYRRGPVVQLACAAPMPFHVEGDNAGRLPVTCSVRSGLLRVIVP